MERRYLQLATTRLAVMSRAEGEAGPSRIAGYAAVFYNEADPGTQYNFAGWWDNFAERIMPGAFDAAIRDDDVRAMFNHNPDLLLGRTSASTLALSVDRTGLRYEITPPDTELGRSVVEAVRRGDLSGSSFSFLPDEIVFREIKDDKGDTTVIREIHRAKLFDVGPVTFPAYESTTTGVRAAGELDEARESYKRWREAEDTAAGGWRFALQARARAAEIGLH